MVGLLRRYPWHIPLIFGVTFAIHHMDRNVMAYSLPAIAAELGWSDKQVGAWGQYLLGAFFVSYGFTQALLAGPAERFGVKRSLIASICGFSLVSIGFGVAGASVIVLVGLRLLLGFAEAAHVPMMGAIIARTFPNDIRATANTIWGTGIKIATAIGPLLIVPLIAWAGWRSGFLVVGALGLLVGVPLVYFFVEAPPPTPQAEPGTVPEGSYAFLRDRAFWAYTVVGLLNNITGFGVLGWLPTYFVRTKHIAFALLAQPLSVIGFVGVAGMLVFAVVGDRLRLRLWSASVGLIVCGFAIYAAQFFSSLVPLVALFALANFGQSTYGAIEWSTAQLIAKDRNVGAVTGAYNGIGILVGGVLGSMIPGAIVAATGNFDLALLAIALTAVLGGLLMGGLAYFRPELN